MNCASKLIKFNSTPEGTKIQIRSSAHFSACVINEIKCAVIHSSRIPSKIRVRVSGVFCFSFFFSAEISRRKTSPKITGDVRERRNRIRDRVAAVSIKVNVCARILLKEISDSARTAPKIMARYLIFRKIFEKILIYRAAARKSAAPPNWVR